jgi:hypothetical protein
MNEGKNDELLSDTAKQKVAKFNEFKAQWDGLFQDFCDKHSSELQFLDNVREEMNTALDEAKRALREEAEKIPYNKVQKIYHGGFNIQKKWSEWYIVEMFLEMARNSGLYDAALAEGVIIEKTEINGKLAEPWLKKNSVHDTFQAALDGKELTPAITGPKPVLPFGSSS